MATQRTAQKTLSIPVSGALRDFVDGRVKSGGYETVSEYVRALIRADQLVAAREELEAKLLEAVERGDYREADGAFWERLRKRTGQRVG